MAFEKSVGAVIFRRSENKIFYLLLHYPGGHWDFPKGHVESGESDEETLRREVEEETEIRNVEILPSFKMQIRYFYRAKEEEKEKRKKAGKFVNISKKVVYYLAETDGGDEIKISFEHTGYAWLEFEKALEKITYDNSKNVIKKADVFLKSKQL
ncbi:MAG TPA: diadenosine tetraphosphate hydrolase [Candidatus Moranbacteria bacterium]|nr:diadenosine tetraphosphate hydrolase [Candidatus Moranbacteria bacterium]